ncbi:hypothetical protein ACFV98_38060 [Streptomyces violascens]|uniref:hypothetical protein n=1 Tax=Streptomyces violascens TaxID=67381 RepID=UPI0036624FE0
MGSVTPDLVDRAVEQRLHLPEFICGRTGADMAGGILRRGEHFNMPSTWRWLPAQEQAARFAADEAPLYRRCLPVRHEAVPRAMWKQVDALEGLARDLVSFLGHLEKAA